MTMSSQLATPNKKEIAQTSLKRLLDSLGQSKPATPSNTSSSNNNTNNTTNINSSSSTHLYKKRLSKDHTPPSNNASDLSATGTGKSRPQIKIKHATMPPKTPLMSTQHTPKSSTPGKAAVVVTVKNMSKQSATQHPIASISTILRIARTDAFNAKPKASNNNQFSPNQKQQQFQQQKCVSAAFSIQASASERVLDITNKQDSDGEDGQSWRIEEEIQPQESSYSFFIDSNANARDHSATTPQRSACIIGLQAGDAIQREMSQQVLTRPRSSSSGGQMILRSIHSTPLRHETLNTLTSSDVKPTFKKTLTRSRTFYQTLPSNRKSSSDSKNRSPKLDSNIAAAAALPCAASLKTTMYYKTQQHQQQQQRPTIEKENLKVELVDANEENTQSHLMLFAPRVEHKQPAGQAYRDILKKYLKTDASNMKQHQEKKPQTARAIPTTQYESHNIGFKRTIAAGGFFTENHDEYLPLKHEIHPKRRSLNTNKPPTIIIQSTTSTTTHASEDCTPTHNQYKKQSTNSNYNSLKQSTTTTTTTTTTKSSNTKGAAGSSNNTNTGMNNLLTKLSSTPNLRKNNSFSQFAQNQIKQFELNTSTATTINIQIPTKNVLETIQEAKGQQQQFLKQTKTPIKTTPMSKKINKGDAPSTPYSTRTSPMSLRETKTEIIIGSTERTIETPNRLVNEQQQKQITPEITEQQLKIEGEIGKGSYATVKLAIHRTTMVRYALKIYPRFVLLDPHKLRNVKREISILKKLSHPYIIRMPFSFEDKLNYVGKVSMHSYLKTRIERRISETDAKRLFKQMTEALMYCHAMNVVHRDIKLENILLDNSNNIKLIDFGFSIIIPEDKKLKIFCGTPSYMAPEIISKQEYVGQKADIWALGILLFAMLQGKFPFKGISDKELFKKIKSANYEFLHPISTESSSLIASLLHIDPNQRPSTKQILNHPWLANSS